LHPRMIGRPGRIGALDRILRHVVEGRCAWISSREAIARHCLENLPYKG
jgi:allantoinase